MTATISNGKPRKQLSDQLDRLDSVIDLLADNLNQAVADAAREGAKQAVKELAAELLRNPDVLNLIRSVRTPVSTPPAPRRNWWREARNVASAAFGVVKNELKSAAAKAVGVVSKYAAKLSGPVERVRAAIRVVALVPPPVRKAVLIGTGVGVAVVVVACASHTLAALASGAVAGVVAAGVHVGIKLTDALRGLYLS